MPRRHGGFLPAALFCGGAVWYNNSKQASAKRQEGSFSMENIRSYPMWILCDAETPGAREVNGYPSGTAYIVRRNFPEVMVQLCKYNALYVLFADGSDAETLTESYVVNRKVELIGHIYDGIVLWHQDFAPGGAHENSFKRVNGELVRLGFSRW